MPVYVCYRGDCDNLVHQQSGSSVFVAKDALAKDWLCIQTTLEKIPYLPDAVAELIQAQALAHRLGFSAEGTQHMMFDCPDEAGLRRQLVLQTYPEVAESEARLMQAGWVFQRSTEHMGWPQRPDRPFQLTLTKGIKVIEAEGETPKEAWHRAAQQAQEKPIMALTFQPIPVPLRTDEHGAIRVGDSQVLFDIVVREFERGSDPESIVRAYSTLRLPDVYVVVAYYLLNRQEVEKYLQARRAEAERLRKEIEAGQPDRDEFREKLLARKAQMEQEKAQREQEHASPRK